MNEWRKQFKFICGHYWTSVQDGYRTYFFMNGILKKSEFGKTNNYAESYIRDYLVNSELAAELKREFGDKLIPISLDLTSMDGFKDYGSVEGDILAILNIQLLMKFGENIPLIDDWYWLANPNQTPKRNDARYVRFVGSNGDVSYYDCGWNGRGVRPFWIGRRKKVRETLKLESRYQKNRQPFLTQKCRDKYKGTKYYDRR